MKKQRLILILISFSLFAGAIAYFTLVYPGIRKEFLLLERKKAQWRGLEEALSERAAHFGGSSGIIVKDLSCGWEFSFQQDKPFASASLVKIPIMAAVFKAAQEGRISLDSQVRLTAADKVPGSGELKNMPVGSVFTVGELTELMIASSDNTAANMLIELLGVDYLNRSFKQMGLAHTNLTRKMMDFRYRRKGVENYTTARDMAHIIERIYRRSFINSEVSQACLRLLKEQKIKDRIPARLPSGTVVAHKTGLERGICHDAGIVYTPEGDILICVLTRGAKNSRLAKAFIAHLAWEAYNSYGRNNLY